MTPEQWQQVRPILESALELDPASRASFLDGACADSFLRREVESLIAAHEQASAHVLEPGSPLGLDVEDKAQFRLPAGKRIGPYQTVGEIGIGGMGEVYRAVRADDAYRKQVAIKLVRSGQNSTFVLNRFRNERQILASLEHPNIARLLDGGTTEEGVPYFVMELVEGRRIDEYCDGRKLDTTERLKLFLQVCSAVQYAHQRLIIHRDIKPGNILVNAEGVPKLLDFGIAKILESSEAGNQPDQTISLLRLLTPEYASPEQIKGEPITTGSDVYSLGVVLYELLTGRAPYQVPTRAPHEISRAVCEAEPEKPSIAARRLCSSAEVREPKSPDSAALSQVREGSPEKLGKRLRGDLDNILLMAMRKEPQRRYLSVEQFAHDIRRHLEHLPVIAREDTLGYRASTFVTRHKVGVAVAGLVALSLLSATGVTLRQARIARAERARAERRFNDVRRLANSLMFEVHDAIRDLPGATAARKLVVQRAQEYLDSLAQESNSDPALLRELAAAYGRLATVQGDPRDVNLGDTPKAVENDRKSVALLESAVSLQPSNPEVRRELAESYSELAMKLNQAGDAGSNEIYLQKATQILDQLASANADDKRVQNVLAKTYEQNAGTFRQKNDSVRSLESYEKALAIYERLGKADPQNQLFQREISFAHKHLGGTLIEQKKLPEALEQYRAALAIDEAQLARNPDSVQDRYNITYTYSDTGFILGRQGDFDAALAYYRKALEIRAALVAADPQDNRTREGLSNTLNYIGYNLFEKKDYRAALESYKKASSIRETLSQKDPANQRLRFALAETESNIGNTYAAMAFSKAVPPATRLKCCRESLAWNKRSLPIWMERKAQGKLGLDAETLATSTRNIEACSRAIVRLDSTARPPAQ